MAEKLDPFDVAALERLLNDSATRVSTIWVSFLIFSLYLLTAATTVTHRQLFLADPLKLPVLNIDLPLWGFFFLAPILFVLLHAYVLLQVLLLARTAAAYNAAVERAGLPPEENASLRQRLANTLFAQIFAGSPRERDGWLGWLLKAMAWITLAIAPILVLLVFQFMFLPYHSHLATWTHRLLIVAELAAAFVLWPLVLDARRDFEWASIWMQVKRTTALPLRLFGPKDRRHDEWVWLRQQTLPVASSVLFVLVSLSLATFPGEPHVNLFTGRSLLSVQCKRWFSAEPLQVKEEKGDWRIFDRLDLPHVIVVNDEKLEKIENATAKKGQQPSAGERTQDFHGRDLNCGTFNFADLRRADFSGVRMSDASLFGSQLQGATLRNAQLQGADLRDAQLQGADLSAAHLQGAVLSGLGAQLQGANLSAAHLQGADLTFWQLQGAVLRDALLQGADLTGARLQGADLGGAQLQGANLSGARLQGANLSVAFLQGADLTGAQLQGADLIAQLQGANLSGAQLQGADLGGGELTLALLSDVFLWRARRDASCSDARMIGPRLDAAFVVERNALQAGELVPATPEAIERFIERVIADVSGPRKDEVRERLHAGLVAPLQENDLAAIETIWRECAANSAKVAQAEYDRQHADLLRDLVCDATTNRKEIAAGIIRNMIMYYINLRAISPYLARGLLGLDGKECAATKDLSDEHKELLQGYASMPAPAN